jgi:hypothetical protein
VRNQVINSSAQTKATKARLAAQTAEDKAKALAAAEANKRAKLAAMEWIDQDGGSMASETWSGSDDESAAPTPRKNGSIIQNKAIQQQLPAVPPSSRSTSKGSVKALSAPIASAADWGGSSSDGERWPTLGGGRLVVRINRASSASGRKRG